MAAPTATQFKALFPEFAALSDAEVEVHLDGAERELDETAFSALYYDAVAYKAADRLCRTPYGLQNQLVNDDGQTVYGTYFNQELQYKCARRGLLSGTDLD
jgi:hypothetical protein